MKKYLFFILVLFVSVSSIAQKNKIKEAGLIFGNLNNFGVTYKIGTETSLWRFNAVNLSGSNSRQDYDDHSFIYSDFGFGLRIGKEFRNSFAKKLEFRYGVDLTFSYSYDKYAEEYDVSTENQTDESILYTPGLNLVVGLNYLISKNFVIGAELLPSIGYSIGSENAINNDGVNFSDISRLSYGLSSSSVQFTVAYRY